MNIPFTELKGKIDGCGLTSLEEVQDHCGAGASCGMCCPYIVDVIKTGKTEFSIK